MGGSTLMAFWCRCLHAAPACLHANPGLGYHVVLPEHTDAANSLRLLYHLLQAALQDGQEQMLSQRHTDYVGSMLWAQSNRATEFFSRWVELKETQKAAEVSAAQPASSAIAVEADETST